MRTKQTPPKPGERALPVLTDRAYDFITARLARRDPPERISSALRGYFQMEIDGDQVVDSWRAHKASATQTERRQDKESVQLPADEPQAPSITPMAWDPAEPAAEPPFSITPGPAPAGDGAAENDGADEDDGQDEGDGQDEEPLPIILEDVVSPKVAARHRVLDALAALARVQMGISDFPQVAPADDAATQTGHRQDKKAPTVLTDAMKTFIVKGLARYESPTFVAAAVQAQFGIAVDRRQVFAYDPTGSRPPARRWIDLHAATRAKFLEDVASIGIAQKVVRLRMLDKFARYADEHHLNERAARFMQQAARECGGFYERHARPKAVAA